MSKWVSDFGGEFDEKWEAQENVFETMETEDYIEGLKSRISFDTLLRYCWGREDFWNDFEDTISDVEQDFFEANYHEVEDEDENEDY